MKQDLSENEWRAVVAALYAYRSETAHYLRGYSQPDTAHDDCCPTARARVARRATERESLSQRLRDIDGALMTLDPEYVL